MPNFNISNSTKSKYVMGFVLVLIFVAVYYLMLSNKKEKPDISRIKEKTETNYEAERPESGEIDFKK